MPALEAPARHLEAEHGTESRLSREQLQCVFRLRPGRIAQWAVSRSRGAESEDTERWLSTQSRRHRRECEQGGRSYDAQQTRLLRWQWRVEPH